MALRIGGGMPPQEEAISEPAVMPEEMAAPPEAMAPPTEAPAEEGGGFIDPESARYFGPESRCQSCIHFMAPGSCEIVSGPIDPQGVCMLFLAGGAPDQGAGMPPEAMEGMPAEESAPTEESPEE